MSPRIQTVTRMLALRETAHGFFRTLMRWYQEGYTPTDPEIALVFEQLRGGPVGHLHPELELLKRYLEE